MSQFFNFKDDTVIPSNGDTVSNLQNSVLYLAKAVDQMHENHARLMRRLNVLTGFIVIGSTALVAYLILRI